MANTEIRSNRIDKPGYIRIDAPCTRCGGSGIVRPWGVCFRCGGPGREPNGERVYAYPVSWTDEQVEAHVQGRKDKAAAARDRKAAKQAAAREAFLATNSELATLFAEWSADRPAFGSFVNDVLWKLDHYGSISERQVEVVLQAAAKDRQWAADKAAQKAADEAAAKPVPTGTVQIEGEVLTTQWRETEWGSSLKVLVKGDGWKVWGSAPSALHGLDKGDVIRFTASVEASNDDPTFGFFKRPRKAELVSEGGQ